MCLVILLMDIDILAEKYIVSTKCAFSLAITNKSRVVAALLDKEKVIILLFFMCKVI